MTEMWWARTELPRNDAINARFDNGAIHIDTQIGPYPEARWSRRYIARVQRILAQFGLGRDRQPAESTLFASSPRVEIDGQIRAVAPPILTPFGFGWVFEIPSEAIFQVQLRQTGMLDDTPIRLRTGSTARAPSSTTPLEVATTTRETDVRRSIRSSTPPFLRFSPLNIWLDGTQDLSIQLEVWIVFWVRGNAFIEAGPLAGEPAFSIRLPQWNLIDVRDIL